MALAAIVGALGGWGGAAMAASGLASVGIQLWQSHKTGKMTEEASAEQKKLSAANNEMAARMAQEQQAAQQAIIAQFAASTGLGGNLAGPVGMPQMAHGTPYPGFMPGYAG